MLYYGTNKQPHTIHPIQFIDKQIDSVTQYNNSIIYTLLQHQELLCGEWNKITIGDRATSPQGAD